MNDLYSQLYDYNNGEQYPMHMPGHKRNVDLLSCPNPYALDITEIDGFDNLHHATGILKDKMELAARCFHADRTFYLVNGSSSGILIGIFSATKRGDTILVARNCHRAVYHAIELRSLVPVYLMPEVDPTTGICKGISAEEVEQSLQQHPEIKLVVLTSPTYEGVLSDVANIALVVHRYGIPLLVDEAHGAHLGFHPDFYQNSNSCGADLVVQSVHKTLPSLTQTALLHCNGTIVSVNKVKEYSAMFQTSSPSYLLMGSIDRCVNLLIEQGAELFDQYSKRLRAFYQEAKELKAISVLNADFDYAGGNLSKIARDASKIVVLTQNITMTGPQLYDILRRDYEIQPEMAAANYVLCMTSIADTGEGFHKLITALKSIDQMLLKQGECNNKTSRVQPIMKIPQRCMSAEQAKEAPHEQRTLPDSINKVVGDYIFLYPPGIPILVPGEIISLDEIETISRSMNQGLHVYGLSNDEKITTVI